MSKKHLRIHESGSDDKHLIVTDQKNYTLGTISPKGEIFKRSPVFVDISDTIEFTSDCLRELADEIDSRFKKES